MELGMARNCHRAVHPPVSHAIYLFVVAVSANVLGPAEKFDGQWPPSATFLILARTRRPKLTPRRPLVLNPAYALIVDRYTQLPPLLLPPDEMGGGVYGPNQAER